MSTSNSTCNTLTTDYQPARMFYLTAAEYQQGLGSADAPLHPHREIMPSPLLNINLETFYSNESLIGYTYNVTLNGVVATRQTREDTNPTMGFGAVVGSLARFQQIFHEVGNGGVLVVCKNQLTPTQGLDEAMMFRGGRIKSLDISPGSNQMVFTSEYAVEIEFNDASLCGCNYSTNFGCHNAMFALKKHTNLVNYGEHDQASSNSSTGNGDTDCDYTCGGTDNGADETFRIKQFSDGFNIDFQDGAYDYGEASSTLRLHNKNYNVTYTVSATGQHYYDCDGNLFPAWKQAKSFCQDRFLDQITAFYNNQAMHYNGEEESHCGSTEDNGTIHQQTSPSIHDTNQTHFNIYDEKVTLTPSEADGTFSINYSATIKEHETDNVLSHPHTNHNFTFTPTANSEHNKLPGRGLTINGTIQGYTGQKGSIVWPNSEGFTIPASGDKSMVIMKKGQHTHNRYERAKNHFTQMYSLSTGHVINGDLCNYLNQFVEETCTHTLPGCPPPELPCPQKICTAKPNSFQATHNVNAGSIDYSIEFTPEEFDNGRCNIQISTEESVPLVAEFTIPGYGVYFQPLGGCTPKRWNITAEGTLSYTDESEICPDDDQNNFDVCGTLPGQCTNWTPPTAGGYLKTAESRNYNPTDRSFSYNASYVCTNCPPGYGDCSS